MGWIRLGAVLAAFLGFVGLYAFERHRGEEIVQLRRDAAVAAANYTAALKSVRIETRIQTVTKRVYIRAQEAADHVKTIDPQCANGPALVAAWRTGLDGVRNASTAGDSAAAVEP